MKKAAAVTGLVILGVVVLGASVDAAIGPEVHAAGECVICNALCWLMQAVHG